MKTLNPKLIYSFLILVLYAVSGILLLVKYLIWQEVPDWRLGAFGLVVIGYGIFRGYRVWNEYLRNKETDREDE